MLYIALKGQNRLARGIAPGLGKSATPPHLPTLFLFFVFIRVIRYRMHNLE